MKVFKIKYALSISLFFLFSSCEKVYKKIGGGILVEFTGEYLIAKKEVNQKSVLLKDTITLSIKPRNAQFLTLSLENWDGTTINVSARRSEYTLYKNKAGNNTIEAYFPEKKKYLYIEDLSGDKKERLLMSEFVDEINGQADSVRYYYESFTTLPPGYER